MTPKPQPQSDPSPKHHSHGGHSRSRLGLGIYLSHPPSSFPPNTVIFQNADFVAIHDKFPKSTIHTLLLPRSPAHNLLHPLEAFQDEQFRQQVQQQVAYLKTLVAKELQRRLGRYSRAERVRQAVLDGGQGEVDAEEVEEDAREGRLHEPGVLPPGRDWEAEVISGVHAVPSMSHLHIHVLSRDMHSESMKHRKHYNSFNTPFLVDVMDWGARRGGGPEAGLERELSSELRCWRCGRKFGNGFKKLKEHLEDEFLNWTSL
ncbi:hypothetical protein E4U58_000296 [Claviceps cyperi]|nr:hypothetical protein E4U58_000296 [Claviceps cyperi]